MMTRKALVTAALAAVVAFAGCFEAPSGYKVDREQKARVTTTPTAEPTTTPTAEPTASPEEVLAAATAGRQDRCIRLFNGKAGDLMRNGVGVLAQSGDGRASVSLTSAEPDSCLIVVAAPDAPPPIGGPVLTSELNSAGYFEGARGPQYIGQLNAAESDWIASVTSAGELVRDYTARHGTVAHEDEESESSPPDSATGTACGAVIGEGTPREITTSNMSCYGAKRVALAATRDPDHGGCGVPNDSGTRVVLRQPCVVGVLRCKTIGAFQTDYSRGECTGKQGQRVSFVFG